MSLQNGIDDPHVVASLFKLWLRELEEPVIPGDLYNAALIASKSTAESLNFVLRLPVFNRRVLLFVISFFQLFLRDDVVKTTKMTPQNLGVYHHLFLMDGHVNKDGTDSYVT